MCLSKLYYLFLTVLLYVYCPHKGWIHPHLSLHGLLNMWECLYTFCLRLPRLSIVLFFTSLCMSCFSSCPLQAAYSNIYFTCLTVSSGYSNMRSLLGCWTGFSQNPCIRCFPSGCFKFRGYYTTLFPRKVIACFGDLFPHASLPLEKSFQQSYLF